MTSNELKKIFPKQNKWPIICAHRGGKENVPENTLAAFTQSAANGITCMENDIQLTKDNEIVIIHDHTADRTSNGKGEIREMTLEQIQKFDAGSWFHPNFKDQKIPTLKQFLNICTGVPLIEIKKYEKYSEKLESILIAQLAACGRLYSSILHSFDLDVLERLNRLNKDLNLGYLVEEIPNDIPDWVGGIHPEKKLLNQENLLEWREQGLWVASWTFTKLSELDNKEDLPDIIITDIPLAAAKHWNY